MTPEQQQAIQQYLAVVGEVQAGADRNMVTAFQIARFLGEATAEAAGPEAIERNRQAIEPHARKLEWLAEQRMLSWVRLPDHLQEPGLFCYRLSSG